MRVRVRVCKLLARTAIVNAAAPPSTICAALQRAKEAGKRERSLQKACQRAGLPGTAAGEALAFAVVANLAACYQACGQDDQALNAYAAIVRSGRFPHAPWLRVNAGNVHYGRQQYAQAVRMYRMALDQVPTSMQGEGSEQFQSYS